MSIIRVCDQIRCRDWPCADVEQARYTVPARPLDPQAVRLVLICEAPAPRPEEHWDAAPQDGAAPFYLQTTLKAFADAGQPVASLEEIEALGVYLTTAIKCGKVGYGVPTPAIGLCSILLEQELALFPNLRALLLMGDVASKAVNAIARRCGEPRVIPSGATYRLRGGEYTWRGWRVLPSYLQTGKSYLIEHSKQEMIAADLRSALAYIG